ncbi:hypothetical protein FNV43_RR24419 [Rhamnella rubrinervis]|uniref:Uncharacterized protein n=1 Tax=Rhamnella rubrinervis TaxID=2594499 RepID=A0A8K0GL70_9ROSA|nr:hypothetical protein FNV43_RR24419 [Rhamnella rubrinervis]
MAPIVLDWNCLAGLNNPVGDHAVENVAQNDDRGKAVPKQGIQTVPMQCTPKEQMLIQGIPKQPSFAYAVNGTPLETNNNKKGKQPSFAAVLNGSLLSRGQPDSALQTMLTHKGNVVFVHVNDDAYQERITLCHWEYWHPCILTDLARDIGIPLKIDNSTLQEIMKSVIGKAPPKVGSHSNDKENKTPSLTQVYKPKQASSLHVESTTPSVPTTNAFEVLNTDGRPTHIEDMTHHHNAVPYSMADIDIKMNIQIRPSAPDLGAAPSRTDFNSEVDAFGDSDDELGNDADDIVENEWPPLQGEGSSKPSKEFDGTPYVGNPLLDRSRLGPRQIASSNVNDVLLTTK